MEEMIENDLAVMASEGHPEACEKLLERHLGLIFYHVNREREGSPLSRDEVMSLCFYVFMKCVYNFRERKDTRFGSYFGTALNYAIPDARLEARHPVVKVPSWIIKKFKAMNWELDCTVDKDCPLFAYATLSVLDGDMPMGDGDDDLFDTIHDDDYEEPFRDTQVVRDAVENMRHKRAREFMRLKLLDYTQSEAADAMRLSRQRAQQLEKIGMDELKAMLGVDDV